MTRARNRQLELFAAMLAVLLIASGCTSSATQAAILNYEKAEAYQQAAFEDACRAVEEQMFLSTSMQIAKVADGEDFAALQSYAKARANLEAIKVQYERARTLGRLTVGQYLYDQQGWGSVLLADIARKIRKIAGAARQANSETGETLPAMLSNLVQAIEAQRGQR